MGQKITTEEELVKVMNDNVELDLTAENAWIQGEQAGYGCGLMDGHKQGWGQGHRAGLEAAAPENTEIEITPEMIGAGMVEYRAWEDANVDLGEESSWPDCRLEKLLPRLFVSMARVWSMPHSSLRLPEANPPSPGSTLIPKE